jgi:hypothetical protein
MGRGGAPARATQKALPARTAAPAKAVPAKAAAAAKQTVRASRPDTAPVEAPLAERAERLRDEILRSKLTHPDPWTYAPKARAWGERAQTLVEQIARAGSSSAAVRSFETLAAEIERDRDFQDARRLF